MMESIPDRCRKLKEMPLFSSMRTSDAIEVIRVPGGFLWIRNPQIQEVQERPVGMVGAQPIAKQRFVYQPCMVFVSWSALTIDPQFEDALRSVDGGFFHGGGHAPTAS